MTTRTNGYFQTRLSLFFVLLMLKELLGIFEISVGNFIRNGCHVGLVGLIRRGVKQNSTLARNPEYPCALVPLYPCTLPTYCPTALPPYTQTLHPNPYTLNRKP